ncbi:helix-turn-helix domain-containing protein [Panacibacter sp. DH6]|uniref:Helix-turn-helix domain-containing protein n=1 Tax=Panacibacter microcysteis TaxID=2793269 RepID=A0A931E5X6_9BACT|nr:AraC family transcriptional regulator [Panacibacter microcysteis]MBG9374964.1 helix-turn-helix domain-containing protein [Panacibacter microcysteis]
MKVKLEAIKPNEESSFTILLTPKLNEIFYWHFHPEYEIVYVEAETGVRHVGDHISKYQGSDLVFIGPNIPHLNFDYGVKTIVETVVIQMKEHFLGQPFFDLPEIAAINELFAKARSGIAFHGNVKKEIGERLKKLPLLPHFTQLVELLQIFQILATTQEYELLHTRAVANASLLKEQQRMHKIYHYIEVNYQQYIDVNEVASLSNLTTAAFCRYFKKATHLTFTDFLNQYRINQAKKLLLHDKNVTQACYESGFENLSHFNKTFKKITGENPSQFKRRHRQ